MKNITLTSTYNFRSGYGELLYALLNDLPKFKYNVVPRSYTPISEKYLSFFGKNYTYDPNLLDLCLLGLSNDISMHNVFTHISFDRPRVLLTMWESTKINDLMIEILSKFNHIIVPNNYNKINFLNQGLNTKIDVVPLFCDTNFFSYKNHNEKNKFIFGVANEDPRKNLNKVINCFIKAFRGFNDVELQVKTCTSITNKIFDSRIKYISATYNQNELCDWYYNLDVYVSGATCEGWGMMQQESMCCGRPVIYTSYGGLKEFINNEIGFEIKYEEVYSKNHWGEHSGKWSEFNEDDMIEKMIYCYNNRDEVKHKGYLAAKHASQFTKELFLKKIDNILSEYI